MDQENIKEAHVFIRGLEFPILIFVCDERQHEWLRYLNNNFAVMHYNEAELCQWCIAHGMQYRILITGREMKNPRKRRRYEQIVRQTKV